MLSRKNIKNTLLGVLLVALLSSLSYVIASFSPSISPLIVAILLGFLYANLFSMDLKSISLGFDFCTSRVLRIAIVLYGFNLTFQDIFHVGTKGVLASILVLASTFLLGMFVAKKVFRLDTHLSLLICSGSSICGAAAVLATESLLKSDANKTAIAVATVVIFGTTSMFLYPLAWHGGFIPLDIEALGIYIGSTLHEVAHVVTASSSISTEVAHDAIIVKMLRVMMIAPMLLLIPLFLQQETKKRVIIPWFALYFILVAGFNSFDLLPQNLLNSLRHIDGFLLTMAMGALGMKTKFKELLKVGYKPFLLAFFLFLWLVFAGFGINYLLWLI